MDPEGWLQKAYDELVELGPRAEEKSADAWRAVVLIGRLLGSPAAPRPPAEFVGRLPRLLALAGSPDVRELLERVAHHLGAEIDPWGPLLDALLDSDDTLLVLSFSAPGHTTRALAQRVAGLVSLHPERVLRLRSFAEMRLATLREGADVGLMWRAVERAAALVLAEALPAAAPDSEPSRPPARVLNIAFPSELLRPAADSGSQNPIELKTDGPGQAWVSEDEGRMRFEATALPAEARNAVLIAERLSDGLELKRVAFDLEVSGDTAYADLGPWAGTDNKLHRLVAETGLKASELQIRLAVSRG